MSGIRYLDGVRRNDVQIQYYKMHRCWARFMLNIFLGVFLLFRTIPSPVSGCAGLDTPFSIIPQVDLVVENGTSVELFCRMDENHPRSANLTSKNLLFYQVEERGRVPLPNTTIINETTIKVDIVNPPLGSNFYYCSLNRFNCLTNVLVGYKPQPVSNFSCTSYNWERLVCTWDPSPNPIPTKYKLKLSLSGRAGRKPYLCPNKLDEYNNTCIYTQETDPQYRQPYETFTFQLVGSNILGNLTRNYKFQHFEHVIPEKPINVRIVNKTVGSAYIEFEFPFPLKVFPPGLLLKVEYKNKWENWTLPDGDFKRYYGSVHHYNLTNLKYHHTAYDVRLYLKPEKARPGPYFWSEPASVTFVSLSTIPSQAPGTTHGCFEFVSNGNNTDVIIYWRRIHEKYHNGANFTYNVICTKDNGKDCGQPLEMSETFAKFPVSGHHSYIFTIYSVNEVGRSEDNSYIHVPQYDGKIQPKSFTKVAYDNGVFELSWKPVGHRYLSNYTIFWCMEDKDLPVPCRGYLDWTVVDSRTTSKNISMLDPIKFYKFAVAANLRDGTSSGMVWSACIIFHNKALKKIDDFHISRVGPHYAYITWEIRCFQSSAIRGFALFYCPVSFAAVNNVCKDDKPEDVIKLNSPYDRNITITDLTPYTTYKIQIAIISIDGSHQIQFGPRSTPKRFMTLEDAPSVPRNLIATAVTNNSISLLWDVPTEFNGFLRSYKLLMVYPNGQKEFKFDAQNVTYGSVVNRYVIPDLVSFTTYNVSLKACTGECSEYTEPIVVKTLIGVPGKLKKPQVSMINSTLVDVSWDLPDLTAGNLDYYQLLIVVDEGYGENELYNLTGFRKKLHTNACKNKYKTLDFKMRAINIDRNNITYYGPWSDPTEVYCGTSVWTDNKLLIDSISGSCVLIIVCICVFYIIKRGWIQCRKMKDVEVKLPPGLQSQDLEKDNQDYVHLERWPPRSPETVTGSVGTVLAPDEESLLDKKSDESMDVPSFNIPIKNGGDSSGCSVGRESGSSSITSDTHISSDSGAEADQCMIPSTALASRNSSGRRNPKNVRNSSPKEVFNFSDFGEWDLSGPAIPRYTKVGFTNGFVPEKNLPGKGYVTIASVTPKNPLQKTGSESTGSGTLTAESFVTSVEHPTSDLELKNINDVSNPQSVSATKYVSLAYFEGQKTGKSSTDPTSMLNGGRSAVTESPKLSRLDESSERNDEKTENIIEEDFSGNETETETIHEVPITRNLAAMPPYVSMIENPGRAPVAQTSDEDGSEDLTNGSMAIEDYEEEDLEKHQFQPQEEQLQPLQQPLQNGVNEDLGEEDEEGEEEGSRISSSSEPNKLGDKKTVNGTASALVDKINKGGTFSNYIPHHLFGKESIHT